MKNIIFPIVGTLIFLAGGFYLIHQTTPFCVAENGAREYLYGQAVEAGTIMLGGLLLWIGWCMIKEIIKRNRQVNDLTKDQEISRLKDLIEDAYSDAWFCSSDGKDATASWELFKKHNLFKNTEQSK